MEPKAEPATKRRSARSAIKARAGAGLAVGVSACEHAQSVFDRLMPLLA
jgi:hypothetical protein